MEDPETAAGNDLIPLSERPKLERLYEKYGINPEEEAKPEDGESQASGESDP